MRVSDNGIARVARGVIIGVMAIALIACTPRIRDYVYVPIDRELAEIIVGLDSSDRVEELFGRPATEGMVRETAWYYVSARQETIAFKAPKTTDRQVVAISFTPNGTVSNVERFGLRDGKVVTLSRRVTDSNTQGIGFLRQLLGNLGRIDPGQFLN